MSAFLEITTINKCLNKCVYCPQDLFVSKYKGCNQLTLDNFKIMIDKLPVNSIISFAGFSEPFVNQSTVDMVEYAFSKGHNVWIFTSLIGLDIDQYKRLLKYSYGYFSIHLPDDLSKTIVPITDKYLETLKFVVNNIPSGNFAFHHHGGNLHKKIKDIVLNSQSIPVHDRSGNLDNEDQSIIRTIKLKGKLRCVHAFLFNSNDGGCLTLPNGDVYLCCNDFGLQHKLGNLINQSWQDIMNSTEMKIVLNGLNDDNSNILCRYCTAARCI